MAEEELKSLKEAIIDLYLAIKIRSTEELDKIDEDHLNKEKGKLIKQDGFQILEYIRSSIEIIMNLKIEDLEKEMNSKKNLEAGGDSSSIDGGADSVPSSSSKKFVHQSMKEALAGQDGVGKMESQKGSILGESSKGNQPQKQQQQKQYQDSSSSKQEKKSHHQKKQSVQQSSNDEPPKEYEKMLQKLEADIRGHIRLEHEMKIHLDYLEGRVEELENINLQITNDNKRNEKKIQQQEDKFKLLREEKEIELSQIMQQKIKLQEKVEMLEKQSQDMAEKYEKEIEMYNHVNNLSNSVDFAFPSNQISTYSQGHPHQSIVGFNEKNIYQTIQDQAPSHMSKSQLQVVATRNSHQILNDKRSLKEKIHLQMAIGSASNLQQKRKRNTSSKGLKQHGGGAGGVVGFGKESIVSLLDYSQRNSNKNIKQNANPYLFEINSSKKISKKKSESIDLQSKRGGNNSHGQGGAGKNIYLRNSQNFAQIGLIQNQLINHSFNHPTGQSTFDQENRWMMQSTDSDNLGTAGVNSKSVFIDYPNENSLITTSQQFQRIQQQQLQQQQQHQLQQQYNQGGGSRSHTLSYSNQKIPQQIMQEQINMNTSGGVGNSHQPIMMGNQRYSSNGPQHNYMDKILIRDQGKNPQAIDLSNVVQSQITYTTTQGGKQIAQQQVILRPSSQLGKLAGTQGTGSQGSSAQSQLGFPANKQSQIRIKDKSTSKSRVKEDNINSSFSTIQPKRLDKVGGGGVDNQLLQSLQGGVGGQGGLIGSSINGQQQFNTNKKLQY